MIADRLRRLLHRRGQGHPARPSSPAAAGKARTRWRVARIAVAGLVVAFVALLSITRMLASDGPIRSELIEGSDKSTLVVMVHGMTGRERFQPAVGLAGESLPGADRLVLEYDASPLSNTEPHRIANTLEHDIHDAWSRKRYGRVVLVGHSMGGLIVRKALIWGHGIEDDRDAYGRKGKRAWVDHVERFVSLAGVNRGWSVNPRPRNMKAAKYMQIALGKELGRLSGSGRMIRGLERGAPFVADTRVQWVRLARGPDGRSRRIPRTIHLLGDRDDIVAREDSLDIAAAGDTVFVTLPNTGHAEIGAALSPNAAGEAGRRAKYVRNALRGEIDLLVPDQIATLPEDRSVTRVIYLMHGIRDYGGWTDHLREAIEREPAPAGERIKVVNKKYGYFPMAPFLLYGDRQENVRRFMDEYTENLARFPHAREFDFVGHSNGTYILASALQQYRTLQVGRVFFAGSVVPKHYPWRRFADEGRVRRVANVLASGDWVVAFFPRLFEQLAEWVGSQPMVGALDIGSGGFRGFEDAQDAQGRIVNLRFVVGGHGAGVDVAQEAKLRAIVAYAVRGDESGFKTFREANEPASAIDFFSNISWLIWIGLGALLAGIGWAARALAGRRVFLAYVVVVIALLNSV